MKITQEQFSRLKELLSPEEFSSISATVENNDISKFQDILNDCIVMRFENEEPTSDSNKLEAIILKFIIKTKSTSAGAFLISRF